MGFTPPGQYHHQRLQVHHHLGGAEDDQAEVVLQDGFGCDPGSDMVGCKRHTVCSFINPYWSPIIHENQK
jgi:hypothetical protein